MPNYKNSKIYTIRSHQTDKIYIGSTTQRLSKRLYEHRKKYRLFKDQNSKCNDYYTSYEILKYEDHYIELIKEFPCENLQQLRKEEGKHIRSSNCVNKYISGRNSYSDYTEIEKKNHNTKRRKEYMENENKRKLILERNRIYHEKNREKIKNRKRQHYKKNKEKFKAKSHERYINMKKEKYHCECGSSLYLISKKRHDKSKKHVKFMNKYFDDIFDNFNNKPIF